MKNGFRFVALVVCAICFAALPHPARAEEYKLREAAEYVKDRDGKDIPHVATSEHFALKWGDQNNKNYKMDEEYVKGALKWFEHIRTVYKDVVGWPYIKSEKDKYKVNIYITETGLKPFISGYAFGFPDPEGYGVLCAEPSCMQWGHGASAHELGHAAEAETGNFRDSDFVGFFWECCAQYLAVQASEGKDSPDLARYADMCQFDFATATNWHQYANWPFMEYFAENPNYGHKAIVNLWMTKAVYQDEDPITKFKRLNKLTDDQWADLVGDYAKKNATFNSYKNAKAWKENINNVMQKWPKALTRWKMALEPIKGKESWYRIPYEAAPHQTAFNVIPLTPTADTISVELKGLVDNKRKSDWRATIVVVNDKSEDRYSNTVKSGTATIKLNQGEKEAYLVVAAAPHVYVPIGFLTDCRIQDRFPYEVKIKGADPKGKDPVKIAPPDGVKGSAHTNGGGFVASTAKVASTAYVGPNAMVLDTAEVKDNARIEDYAVISKAAVVSGDVVVSGHALVTDKAKVSGSARIRDYAKIFDSGNIEGNARFFDYAEAEGSPHVYDNAVCRGHSNINGGNLHGNAIFIGATNPDGNIKDCVKGIYWKYMGQEDCDKATDSDGLFASFDFNGQNNLHLKDSIARGDGFLCGNPEWVKIDQSNSCLKFNGKDQYIEMPRSISDLRDFDLTISINWAGGAPDQKVFDFGRNSKNCMYFTPKSKSGKPAFVIVRDGKSESIDAPAIEQGKWVKLGFSLKGDNATLSVDGKEVASGAIKTDPENLKADSNYLARGQECGYFNGQLDDLKVFIRDGYTKSENK